MFASRIARNIGPMGNKLVYDKGVSDRQMLVGAGGLAALTGLVYWTGYRFEGTSKAGKEMKKQREAEAASHRA